MNQLVILNQRGLFPTPNETEAAFFTRVSYLGEGQTPAPLTKEIFSISPDWVQVDFSAKGLMPWEGAATWIEGDRVSIQIKKSFLTRFYSQEEMIAHEMVHAMRNRLDSTRFEEILAYRVSKAKFRRFFGPLFSSPAESKAFMLALVASWLLYLVDIGGNFVFLAPIALLGYGLFRLVRSQKIFAACLKKWELVTPGLALAVALHLTDEEIALFAKMECEEIVSFAEKQNCLRWKQIVHAYL
ncbi:MAG: hypothetical protein HYX67_10155 [Candidatus Melainabacteria bacterium]|nr:hypothetical protein [Candidatus Melainabacteria bacterium]